jgi:hypothetical protein
MKKPCRNKVTMRSSCANTTTSGTGSTLPGMSWPRWTGRWPESQQGRTGERGLGHTDSPRAAGSTAHRREPGRRNTTGIALYDVSRRR